MGRGTHAKEWIPMSSTTEPSSGGPGANGRPAPVLVPANLDSGLGELVAVLAPRPAEGGDVGSQAAGTPPQRTSLSGGRVKGLFSPRADPVWQHRVDERREVSRRLPPPPCPRPGGGWPLSLLLSGFNSSGCGRLAA